MLYTGFGDFWYGTNYIVVVDGQNTPIVSLKVESSPPELYGGRYGTWSAEVIDFQDIPSLFRDFVLQQTR